MKKLMVLLMVLTMLLVCVAGCSGNQEKTGKSDESATEEAAKPDESSQTEEDTQAEERFDGVTLNIVGTDTVVTQVIMEHQDELYEKYGITLNFQQFSNEQASNKLAVSFAAGSSDIDAFLIRPLDEARLFMENGWLENLQPYIEADAEEVNIDDYYEASMELVTNAESGDVYALPCMTESAVVFYNKTVFEEKGIEKIPTTMEELYETAALLDDPDNGICGFACRGAGNSAVTQFSCFLRAFGADFFDENGNAAINTPEAVEAFEYYGKILRDYGPDGVLNMGVTDTWSLLVQGKAAMRVDVNSNMGGWDPANSTISLDELGFFQIPVGPNGDNGDFLITAWAMGINAASENKEAAWTFLKWANSAEMQIEIQKSGGSSPRASAWADNYSGWPEELQQVSAKAAEVAVSTDRPLMTNVSKARDIIGEVIVAAIEGDQDIQAIADEKNAEFQELLDSEK